MVNKFFFRAIDKIADRLDLFERRAALRMRQEGRLLYLSELIPHFSGKKLFMFGNGGSVDNLQGVSRLKDYNLLSVHNGPVHFYRKYGFVPNLWYLHYGRTADVVMKEERDTPLDLSGTFILVPANDSVSNVYFSSPVVREFRKRHPEATYVLYREIRDLFTPETISVNYLEKGVEPIMLLGGGNVENCFLPLCGFWGSSTLYFSGVDHLPTGHFYDRDRLYQSIDGKLLDFPEKEFTLRCAGHAQKAAGARKIRCYRLEEKETVLLSYPHMDFEEALKDASPVIRPDMLRR